jgi:peptidyl-prolyl cis-trans isomerase C
MKKRIIPLILIASTTLLTACNDENTKNNGSTAVTVSKEDAIAVVNGQYISKAALAALEGEVAQRGKGQSFPKEKLIEELIQRELLIQDAVKKQLDKSADFTQRLTTIRNSLLSQEAVQDFIKSNPITETDLEAEYKKKVAVSGTEYKARHILVKTEEDAKKLIEELNAGADFIELAKNKSTGPSGPKGGDLGWFTADRMVPPFSEAAIALEDGKYTTTPVKTQFGWHVILKEGSRSQTPPPFESVKEQLRPMLQRQKMMDFMKTLREQAKVEILLPAPEAPAPAAEKPAAKDVKADAVEKTSEVVNATENTVNKIAESVQATTKDATTKITEAVEKASDTASETVTKTVDSVTQ